LELVRQIIATASSPLSRFLREPVAVLGDYVLFTYLSCLWWFRRPYRFGELVKHMEFIGNKSISIICLTGAFTGMALSFQVHLGFVIINATSLVGPTVGLGITRELAPVLTGLIVSARAGGAMAARLGTMRVTEQIDALEVMGVNPKQYLIAPRIVASVLVVPLLVAIFDYVALLGAYLVTIRFLGLDEAIFTDKLYLFVDPEDIFHGIVKGCFFGFIFASICSHSGFNTKGGAKGVGEATNRGVVTSMVVIVISDYFLTNLIIGYFRAVA